MRITSPTTRLDRNPFIGRRRECEELRAALARGTGLITLAGPSGVGKTRLAMQVAGGFVDQFSNQGGVWLCSLAGCRETSDLEAAVAQTLGIQHHQGDELARNISHRGPLLLLLDNADPVAHLIGEVVEGWLHRCIELQLLVTSLVPLGIQSERVFELRPLDPNDAVDLYLDRARRAWADRSFSGTETSEILELVERLDRLPLALELAAARVRILPPRTMLSMFEKRFDLLRAAPPPHDWPDDLPQRKSSLLQALELTWSHLEPREQLALARAAVFEGGFTADAAASILEEDDPEAGASPAPPRLDVPRVLADLHRKSLLATEDTEPPRYVLLESIKAYARSELQRMGRWEETLRRHADHYLAQGQAQAELGKSLSRASSIPWLKEERANLLAIHLRFLSSAPSLSARAGTALAPLLLWEGPSAAGTRLIEATLGAARSSGDPRLILLALEPLFATQLRSGSFDRAEATLHELVELARSSGDEAAEAICFSLLARLYLEWGEVERSVPALHRAAGLSRKLELPHVEATVRLAQGTASWMRGDMEHAGDHFVRSAHLAHSQGFDLPAADALYHLGHTLACQRKYADARRAMGEAIQVCERLEQRAFEAHFRFNLAKIELAAGLLDDAEATSRRSLLLFREFGNRFREGAVLGILGVISLERGELDAALEWLSPAEEILHACDAVSARAVVLSFFAVLEARRGHAAEAQQMLDEVRAYVRSGGKEIYPPFLDGAEAFLEVAALRQLEREKREGAEATILRARARLAALEKEEAHFPSCYATSLSRLLTKELADWDAGSLPPPAQSTPILAVGEAHDWFRLPGNQRVDLRNRPGLQRLFAAMVRARIDQPGAVIGRYELSNAAWPNAEMAPGRELLRLYTAIWLLRDLGLRNVILNEEDGYLLDPSVPVCTQDPD